MQETERHRRAFEDYYALGDNRSLPKLRDEYTKKALLTGENVPAIDTLKKWSRTFNWQERILLREKEVADKLSERFINGEINIRAGAIADMGEYLKYLKAAAQSAFYKDPRTGKEMLRDEIKVKNPDQLIRTITAIFKGEEVLQKLVEPELKIKGKMEYEMSPDLEDALRKYDDVVKQIREREAEPVSDERS